MTFMYKISQLFGKLNPIRYLMDYNRKNPIVAKGDIIHLCFEQYGEIKPFLIKDIVINRGYVENYDMKVPDYIRLIQITSENEDEIMDQLR